MLYVFIAKDQRGLCSYMPRHIRQPENRSPSIDARGYTYLKVKRDLCGAIIDQLV